MKKIFLQCFKLVSLPSQTTQWNCNCPITSWSLIKKMVNYHDHTSTFLFYGILVFIPVFSGYYRKRRHTERWEAGLPRVHAFHVGTRARPLGALCWARPWWQRSVFQLFNFHPCDPDNEVLKRIVLPNFPLLILGLGSWLQLDWLKIWS